jgi:hypothetical protein
VASVALQDVSVSFPIYDASARSLKKRLLAGRAGGRIASAVQAIGCFTQAGVVPAELID